jgi:hypothetical protein
MNGREQVQAVRDALSRAHEADGPLRSVLADAMVWLTLAVTDDSGEDGV